MKIRDRLINGDGRLGFTVFALLAISLTTFFCWPSDSLQQEKILRGLQSIAFVAAAFAVTAYNLRTRVVDLVLKIEGNPSRIAEFCGIARRCGKRLTNLVVLFIGTSALLASMLLWPAGSIATRIVVAAALGLLGASVVSFVYVLFAFERLERFALDGAEESARKKEAERLFKDSE